MQDKKLYLDNLHYKKEFDNQQGNLEVCSAYKDKEGTPKFSKWKKYLDCDEKFISKANNRTILPNEVVIDLEEPERFEEVLEQVKKDFKFYSAYKTGSKGYHIHLWFNGKLSPDEKRVIIQRYGCDEQKAIERCMIALENCPHWKTGNQKTIIEESQGINEVKQEKKKISKIIKQSEYSFLDNDEIIYDNLNQGVHKGFWYFGKLFMVNGEEKEGIVTTNKEILMNNSKIIMVKGEKHELGENQIKDFGLNYKHNLEINKNFWHNKSIKAFLGSDEKIERQFVFDKIKKTISYYMDVKDERIFDVVTCWVIGTYCYELFESFGYLYFHALRESGKSKFKKILRLIGFNGQEASSISEASFFRTIENTKGVLAIDEYERMDTDRKKSTDLLLNAGIEKGASVKRVDKVGNKQVNRDFDVYCPKIICNITGLDPVTQTRCITIRLSKTASDKGSRKPKTNDNSWQELRNFCYRFVMDYWEEIKDIYENYNSPLKNRDEDVWVPTLVLARFFGVEEEVKNYAETNIQETQIENIENDRTYLILKELLDYFKIKEETENFHLTDLVPYLKERLDFGEKNAERVVGWHLTNLNIFDKGRDGKGITYSLGRKKILLALVSRGYPIPEKYKESVKELHNTTHTTLTTTITETTQDFNEKGVVSEVNVVNVGKNIGDTPKKCCGNEFEEKGQSFLCGQLWKGNERKYCSNCRDEVQIDFNELDLGGSENE